MIDAATSRLAQELAKVAAERDAALERVSRYRRWFGDLPADPPKSANA